MITWAAMNQAAARAGKRALRKQLSRWPWQVRAAVNVHVDSVYTEGVARQHEARQDVLDEFMRDVDLRGGTLDEFMARAAAIAATFGIAPIGVDLWTPLSAPVTRAAEVAAGNRPYLLMVSPLMLRRLTRDPLTGAVLGITFIERCEKRGDEMIVSAVEWPAATWTRLDGRGVVMAEGVNSFGFVPFVLAEYGEGLSLVGQLADIAKELFNLDAAWATANAYVSDPTLVLTGVGGTDREAEAKLATGVARAIQLPEGDAKYLQVDPSYAANYEKRRDVLMHDFRQAARLQSTLAIESRAPVSGLSRSFDFRETSKALAYLARRMEHAERSVLRIWARAVMIDDQQFTITYPQDFGIDSLETRTAELLAFLDLGWPRDVEQAARIAYLRRHPDFDDNPEIGVFEKSVLADERPAPTTGFDLGF